jgi:glycosyltransferase involved in cell wall biosynthesis
MGTELDRDEVIVFMGSMNAMPMMYALELRKLGFEVLYFVDVSRRDALSRPESHFPEISYPYPPWIIEVVLPSQMLLPLLPGVAATLYRYLISRHTRKKVGCFFLNGFFVSLIPYLAGGGRKIGLSHGSDLDVWANEADAGKLASGFARRSVFKYMPRMIAAALVRHVVRQQYRGFEASDAVVYFPIGFSVFGDKVIDRLLRGGVDYVPRYDASFLQLEGQPRAFRRGTGTLNIFSVVRFLFRTFPEGDPGSNKGNDLMIEGIAKYYASNRNIQVHFVEKGEDVAQAKQLCREWGIEEIVVWHQEMPFRELLSLMARSDICFDQLGSHWIGAGVYAMYLGKPLIANTRPAVQTGTWPPDNPVCSAGSAQEVYEWLARLEDAAFREQVSVDSRDFVEHQMSPLKVLNRLFGPVSVPLLAGHRAGGQKYNAVPGRPDSTAT